MFVFSWFSTDNDNRPKLEPIAGNQDCQHDYINASFIDVSLRLCAVLLRERV